MRLGELALRTHRSANKSASSDMEYLQPSQAFSDFSFCSRDLSREFQRLASLPSSKNAPTSELSEAALEPGAVPGVFADGGLLDRDHREHFAGGSSAVGQNLCRRPPIDVVYREAICRVDNRALIDESGVVPALLPLLRCSDPQTQEHAVTALSNLSLHELTKAIITFVVF